MTSVLGVDLAAKWSACVELAEQGTVGLQWSTMEGQRAEEFVWSIGAWALARPDALAVVVEDLPMRMPYWTREAKVAAMHQGRLLQHWAEDLRLVVPLLFVTPLVWQRACGVKRAADSVPVAAELGYVPPTHAPGVGRKLLAKQRSDFCAAFLIARWARSLASVSAMLAVGGVSDLTSPLQQAAQSSPPLRQAAQSSPPREAVS